MLDKIIKIQLSILILIFSVSVYADNNAGSQRFERCMSEVAKVKQGNIIKLEFKREENGMMVYEYDISDENGRDWEVQCQAETGKIIELEREVSGVNDKAFSRDMKINLAQAKMIVLKKYPGKIVEIEYELKEDGRAIYEFDIHTKDGKEMKIEVEAASGNMYEEAEELWQIGYE